MIAELTNLLSQVPKKSAYITVPRRMLVRVYKQAQAMSTQLQAMSTQADAMAGVPNAEDGLLSAFVNQGLTKIEFLLLRTLLQNQGQVVPSSALIEAANIKTENSLWVHIRRLRQKIKDEYVIESWRKHGYMLRMQHEDDYVQ